MFKLFLCIFLFLTASGISYDWNPHLSIQENCERAIIDVDEECKIILMKEKINAGEEYRFLFLCGKKCAYYEVLNNVR